MLLYFASLPVIRARQQWSLTMPNAANISFNFYYFLVVTMLLYIPCELSHTFTTPLYPQCSPHPLYSPVFTTPLYTPQCSPHPLYPQCSPHPFIPPVFTTPLYTPQCSPHPLYPQCSPHPLYPCSVNHTPLYPCSVNHTPLYSLQCFRSCMVI